MAVRIFQYQVHLLKKRGNLMELVDKRLGEDFNKEEVMVMINVALLCSNVSPSLRPSMSSVVSMLEGRTIVQEVMSERTEVLEDKKFEMMRQYYQERVENITVETQSKSASTDDTSSVYKSNTDSSLGEIKSS